LILNATKKPTTSDMSSALRILSLIPPMTQLNTPYPSTAYLTGFLRTRGLHADQADLSLGLALQLLSADGLDAIGERVRALPQKQRTPVVRFFAEHVEVYRATVSSTVRFLQGRDPSLAHRIASRRYLPEGPRFLPVDQYLLAGPGQGDALAWAFGALGLQDRAKHLATLYLNDLADVIRDAIDPRFEFVRYAESLAASQPTFDQLHTALRAPETLVDQSLDALTRRTLARYAPNLVLVTAPFPGNVYGAFRIAQTIKRMHPTVVTVLGGGYCNTELRSMHEPRVFDYFDFVTLDAGERPLLALIEHLEHRRPPERLVRTYTRMHGYVDFKELGCRNAHLRRSAVAGLPVAARHAQSDASPLVRWPLEQAHRRARLLLEEMQLLRREPRLHFALRPRRHRRADRSDPVPDVRNRPERISLRG
jgi:hypothetical protein